MGRGLKTSIQGNFQETNNINNIPQFCAYRCRKTGVNNNIHMHRFPIRRLNEKGVGC